jgi:hypothetical protein
MKNKVNYIHGAIAILFGLVILIWGPINYRGGIVSNWVGFLFFIFGILVVIIEKRKN